MARARTRADVDRLDVPRTIRGLYPDGRMFGRLRITVPGQMRDSDRGLRWLRRGFEAIVFAIVYAPLGALAFATKSSHRLGIRLGLVAANRSGAAVFRTSTNWWSWRRWARARGGQRVAEAPRSMLVTPDLVELPAGDVPAYRVIVGPRRIGVEVCAVAVRGSSATHHGAYILRVRLPAGVAARFPGSLLRRRRGLGLLNEVGLVDGTHLPLESIRFEEGTRLHVTGGDELDWRRLFDPALLDLLAEGAHAEWYQRGDELLLHAAAPMSAVASADGARLDALCVAAAALERRFAMIAGDGVPIAPVPAAWVVEQRRTRRRRHLAAERRRDLELTPEEQFAELARYTSDAEVANVRAQVDAGTFRLEWLDDLVHHRRARFWGERGDQGADGDPGDA